MGRGGRGGGTSDDKLHTGTTLTTQELANGEQETRERESPLSTTAGATDKAEAGRGGNPELIAALVVPRPNGDQ